MTYKATIGLEIHAELRTRSKMFCESRNNADEEVPNMNICPVCLGHPGTLPVINREAVRQVLRVGVALASNLADYTEFDRKNYFYPDLPKGYQISQYQYPLVSGGTLHGIPITRIHLEEDTASSIHNDSTGETLIDYNRAGVPLMELVTEPDIHSAEQAGSFARELQVLLRYLGASNANMEKGEMRVEANISVAPEGELGTKVEVKNLNSFRAMERAIKYEISRQSERLASGGTVVQQTLGWDEGAQKTFPQRIKEGSADYRYFPDPDLPSLKLSDVESFTRSELERTLPELPWARRERYVGLGLKSDDAEQYVNEPVLGDYFDAVSEILASDRKLQLIASNYIANDLTMLMRDVANRDTDIHYKIPISHSNFAALIGLVGNGRISSRGAKDILAAMVVEDGDPEGIAEQKGLLIRTDGGAIDTTIEEILSKNLTVVSDYKSGKEAALQFLIGQCMRALKGAVDPTTLKQKLIEQISRVEK